MKEREAKKTERGKEATKNRTSAWADIEADEEVPAGRNYRAIFHGETRGFEEGTGSLIGLRTYWTCYLEGARGRADRDLWSCAFCYIGLSTPLVRQREEGLGAKSKLLGPQTRQTRWGIRAAASLVKREGFIRTSKRGRNTQEVSRVLP